MNPQLLVVTPTLGKRETLKKTIESVSAIGGPDVHHVIVCPQEKILDIQMQYGKIDCMAEPLESRGIYAALNYVFQILGRNYKYLSFLNDDDYWLPSYQKLLGKIMEDETLDLVYGKTIYVNSKEEILGTQTCSGQFPQFITLLKRGIVLLTQQAVIMRSDLYFRVGGFDENFKLVSDTKFWAQASLLNIKYLYLDKIFAAYRIQQGQLSSDYQLQKDEHKRMLKEIGEPKKKDFLAVLKFRVSNISVYFSRFLRKGMRIENPLVSDCYV